MSSIHNFDHPLIIQLDPHASQVLGGDYWRVMKEFRYYLAPNRWVYIASGMLTDLGSIPTPLKAIEDEQGIASPAYVVHDQLCEYLSITVDGLPQPITRQQADLVLLRALGDCGIASDRAQVIYRAVEAYSAVMNITEPSTTALKRQLEADFTPDA